MTTFTVQFESRDEYLVGDIMDRNYDVITFISKNTFILRGPRVANFADIIQNAARFINTIFKDSKKLKVLEIMY